MIFEELPLKGAYLIKLQKHEDNRGFFARAFCKNEFKEQGIDFDVVQSNLSFSEKKGTLRGMHYQIDGAEEMKLVRCTYGKILDVIIDLRKDSETFGKHYQAELSHENGHMMFVPEGFAHGFLTLEENSFVFYQVSNYYAPGKEAAIRWNDPFFGIKWPVGNPVLSERDANHPDYNS